MRVTFFGRHDRGIGGQDRHEVSEKAHARRRPAKTVAGTTLSWMRARTLILASPLLRYKIQTAPFYAAWATPVIHDTRAGFRINAQCQVIDLNGQVIPGLYCGGESAGGFSQHGLADAPSRVLSPARMPPRKSERQSGSDLVGWTWINCAAGDQPFEGQARWGRTRQGGKVGSDHDKLCC